MSFSLVVTLDVKLVKSALLALLFTLVLRVCTCVDKLPTVWLVALKSLVFALEFNAVFNSFSVT